MKYAFGARVHFDSLQELTAVTAPRNCGTVWRIQLILESIFAVMCPDT